MKGWLKRNLFSFGVMFIYLAGMMVPEGRVFPLEWAKFWWAMASMALCCIGALAVLIERDINGATK